MTIHSRLFRKAMLGVVLLAAFVPFVWAGPQVRLKVYIHDLVVDEQNTDAFYNGQFCPGVPNIFMQPAMLRGDSSVMGSSTAYEGFPAFNPPPSWQPVSNLLSTAYEDKTYCGPNCVRALLDANTKILSLDTRGTIGPRKLTLGFSQPCDVPGCPSPAGSPTVFGGSITTPMLVNISMTFPYLSMGVCSSVTCPEAEPAFAKVWFADPSASDVTWRGDWQFLRVLRMSATTWYIVADGCDGTQIAGLSKLIGNRTRPKTIFNGYYRIPFFVVAEMIQ